ncbi:hypothetical protein EDD80_103219 [Anseongella ginsenosidimutans]|uniref:Uncharacterized protein n=1 Tax=Anseongella ginsenosidimutans TaxID=496056 RepID=A0A4R3KUL5_9SPHI|nr:hypothetical protein [Anseongella ginsenosidimutans]QEC53463.1 hypothetical protein FRZ59_14700 [Anseongella ginsenosidimutans]TCS88355.1 hypothetical protein EDD80_103219 [Anseongella ginsenosidimutans]
MTEKKEALVKKIRDENYEAILKNLKGRAALKQAVYKEVCQVYKELLSSLEMISGKLKDDIAEVKDVEIELREINQFESMLKFGSDVLIVSMHSNVFYVNPAHFIHKTGYVKEDNSKAYCGVIHIHNFLADSIKYNRTNDTGYLVARIFINKERHFFVEGRGQFSFLYEDFSESVLDKLVIDNIVELAINHSIEFDLVAPDFEHIKAISLMDKQLQYANSGYQTDKQLGYKFSAQAGVK